MICVWNDRLFALFITFKRSIINKFENSLSKKQSGRLYVSLKLHKGQGIPIFYFDFSYFDRKLNGKM